MMKKAQPKPVKGKKTGDPDVYKLLRPMADSLMNESIRKKIFANEQTTIAKAQIKKDGGNVPMSRYPYYPSGNERMKIANKARKSASMDSARAVQIKPSLTPKKKK